MGRRLRIAAGLLLLLAEVVILALQPVQGPGDTTAIAAGEVRTMATGVHQDRHTTTFTLKGHPPDAVPTLTVHDGEKDLSRWLLVAEHAGDETSQRLSYMGVEMYPARLLTFAWQVGEEQVTGEYLYIHPNFSFAWQMEQRGPFVFYHTGTLNDDFAAEWTAVYHWLGAELEMEPVERVIYLLPDQGSLTRALGSDPLITNVAGLWVNRLEAILTSTSFSPAALRVIMAHEFVHAYLANDNPPWWEEGIARWFELRYLARFGPLRFSAEGLRVFEGLEQEMAEQPVYLMRINHSQKSPLDPYTVGYSFCSFVESRWGEERLTRLAATAARKPLREAVVEVLEQSLDEVEVAWQEYVRSGAMLEGLTGQ